MVDEEIRRQLERGNTVVGFEGLARKLERERDDARAALEDVRPLVEALQEYISVDSYIYGPQHQKRKEALEAFTSKHFPPADGGPR